MGKKTITVNYLYNLAYQVLTVILPLITAPYLARVLGAENIGIFSYTLSISAYFILFGTLGTALYAQREIAFNQNDKTAYTKTFWEMVFFRAVSMLVSVGAFYFFFVRNNDYSMYYKILLLELLASVLDISWFFQGLEEFKKTVTRNIVIKLISVVCVFTFVRTQKDIIGYFVIYVVTMLLGNLSLWFYLPKFLCKVSFTKLRVLRHIKPTLALFIPQIAIQVYTLLDKTMIGAIIADKSEVGYYEQAHKIISILNTVIGSLGIVMMPRIANSFSENNMSRTKEYLKKSFSMAFMLSFPFIAGLVVIADTFVPLFFGAQFMKSAVIMKVISPILLFIGVSGTIGHQYLLPTRQQVKYTSSVICGAVINLIMNAFLISKYGAIGAAVGTVVAEFSVTIVQIIMVRKELYPTMILKTSFNYFISALIMFGVCYAVGLFFKNGIVALIVQIAVGIVVYILSLCILKDEFFVEQKDKFFNKFKEKLKSK